MAGLEDGLLLTDLLGSTADSGWGRGGSGGREEGILGLLGQPGKALVKGQTRAPLDDDFLRNGHPTKIIQFIKIDITETFEQTFLLG